MAFMTSEARGGDVSAERPREGLQQPLTIESDLIPSVLQSAPPDNRETKHCDRLQTRLLESGDRKRVTSDEAETVEPAGRWFDLNNVRYCCYFAVVSGGRYCWRSVEGRLLLSYRRKAKDEENEAGGKVLGDEEE
jgi:hypothetical protein